jgi:hypothetical protein
VDQLTHLLAAALRSAVAEAELAEALALEDEREPRAVVGVAEADDLERHPPGTVSQASVRSARP